MDCNLEVVCVCVCLFGPHPVLGARYCVLCVVCCVLCVVWVWLLCCCEYDVIAHNTSHTLCQHNSAPTTGYTTTAFKSKVIIISNKIEDRRSNYLVTKRYF